MEGQPSETNRTTRRGFLRSTAAAALGAASVTALSGCGDQKIGLPGAAKGKLIKKSSVILFQGDSITDAGRDRRRENNPNDSRALGKGYAFLAACHILAQRADDGPKIYNRGISGNKVFQLADRWDKDCLSLKPDILSILIGVNDIWHKLNGKYDGTVEIYEKDYHKLLTRTRKALPDVTLVVCEPFVLRCGAINDKWFPEFDGFRRAAANVASAHGAVFIPFQTMFDKAVEKAQPSHWAGDGVHPSMAGAALMAQAWIKAVG